MEQPVKDKAPKPQGLMPKNLQAMVIAGLAFLMVAVMALTGRKAPQPVATPAAMTPPPPPPVDEAKILAFRNSIQNSKSDSDADLDTAPWSADKPCSPAPTRPKERIRTNPAGTLRDLPTRDPTTQPGQGR